MTQKKDPLHHLPLDKWNSLQEAFVSDWPRCISGYYILEIQRKWLKEGLDYGFKVLCPFGDIKGGMVAIHKKGDFYEIFIDCASDDTRLLDEALRKTEAIHWNCVNVVMFAQRHIVQCIKGIVGDFNVSLELSPLYLFVLSKGSPLFDISLSPEMIFKRLPLDHVDLIDSKWVHRYPGSTSYFKTLIQKDFGYGLFIHDQLISWVFIKETGALGHLYTLEEHRRRGYGELTLKLICNVLLKADIDVFSFILEGNVQSCQLHERLGFQRLSGVGSCHLNYMK